MSTLREVSVGSTARVALVDGVDPVSERLLEMGLTPGVRVKVVGTAPLGCPVELELRGYRLSIRRSEAARVAVTGDAVAADPGAPVRRRPAPR